MILLKNEDHLETITKGIVRKQGPAIRYILVFFEQKTKDTTAIGVKELQFASWYKE
ncbi:MAG: hypothetical protein ACRC6O_11525 [Flavobacterium sp.]